MASFKINIADPKTGKCYKTEVKDQQAASLIGLNIGENIEGVKLGIEGYEFSITGGTDYCGFPMRRGILGMRKKITMYRGLGYRGGLKGMKKRKTVCGHKINEKISAINLKVLKEGAKKLPDLFGSEQKPKEEQKAKKAEPEKEKPEEEKKEEQKTGSKDEEKEEKAEGIKKAEKQKLEPQKQKEESKAQQKETKSEEKKEK